MSTLAIRDPRPSKLQSLFGGFARAASLVGEVLDVLNEAQRQAYEAERRYPFMSAY